MPNLAGVLKAEIARLARKESRSQVESLKKASVQQRGYVAELKRRVALLEKDLAAVRRERSRRAAAEPAAETGRRVRFVAKGLRAHRERLGLSADDYGRLIGVSGQSIYNWEHETAKPREAQKARLASLRTIGVREARARLEQLDGQ